jgi:hypothetical protein
LSSSVFAPDARLVTLDGSTLLQEPDRLVNFYKSLAAWRQRTLVKFKLEKVQLQEWRDKPAVQVDYWTEANAFMPGAASVRLRGTDVFTLCLPTNWKQPVVKIQEVRQTKLTIGDSVQSAQESSLFFRSLTAAIQTGRMGDDIYDDLWSDFLQRISGGTPKTALPLVSDNEIVNFQRSDAAASTVYRLMEALLTECLLIVDKSASSRPPACDYMSENIQLLGYLGETLVRGRSSYERSFGFSLASLKAALRSGQLVSEREPEIRVELTMKRNVKLSLTLFLKAPPLINLPGFDTTRLIPEGGVPLKLGLLSEYILDPETGLVKQHQLLESRINGQLTPGDIVSRWIQRQRGISSAEGSSDTESFMKGLFETLTWVRSLADAEKKP